MRKDLKSALFANADLPQWAEAYAQTLTYSSCCWRVWTGWTKRI